MLQQPQVIDYAVKPLDDLGLLGEGYLLENRRQGTHPQVLHVDEDFAFIYRPGVHLWHGHPREVLAEGEEGDSLLSPDQTAPFDYEAHAVEDERGPAPDEAFIWG